MSEFMESTGKNVDEAVREALLRMGLRREEVDVTVIQKDRGGFMGVGRRQAVVRVEKKAGGGRGGGRGGRGGDADGGRGERLDDGRGRGSRGGRRSASGLGRDQGQGGRDQGQGGRGRDQGGRGRDQGGRGRDQGGRGRDQGGRGRDQGGRRQGGEPAQQEAAARQDGNNIRSVAPNEQRNDGASHRDEQSGESRNRRRRPRRRRKPAADVEAAVANPTGNGKLFGEERSESRTHEDRPQDRPETPVAAAEPRAAEPTERAAQEPVVETAPAPTPETPGAFLVDGQLASARVKPFTEADTDPLNGFIERVATGLMVKSGFPCRVQVKDGEYQQVKMVVDDRSASVLIGRHGATVDAIESLVEKISSHTVGDRVRMNLDINNYRLRQHDSVEERARNAAAEARNTGEPVPMAPMHGRERRLVHLEVEEMGDLVTYTVDGPDGKFVMICREDQVPSVAAVAANDAVIVPVAAGEPGETAAVITDDAEDIDDEEPRLTED